RERAADKARYSFIPAPGSNPPPEAAAAFTGLVMADINWQMAKKSYNAEKDAVAMSVIKAYYEVLKALEGVQAAELSYKSAEISRQVALASYRAGVFAKSGLIQAESGLAQANSALEAAKKALDDAYQQFNVLVGLWPEDRPVLVDRPSFTPLQADNLEAEVERAAEESPSLWMAKKNIDLARLNLDL
ncbi:MAG: TolC family protein, partial [Moorella sp. (in: Bacteria)]|nr:TolC family protein [Moorella sp. (in: firmicutes)]